MATLSNGQIVPANLAELNKTLTEFTNRQFPEPAPASQLKRLQDEVVIKGTAEKTAKEGIGALQEDVAHKYAETIKDYKCQWRFGMGDSCINPNTSNYISKATADSYRQRASGEYNEARFLLDEKNRIIEIARGERIAAESAVNAYPQQFQAQLDAWSVRKGAFDKQKGFDELALTEAIIALTLKNIAENDAVGLNGKTSFDKQETARKEADLLLNIKAVESGTKVSANVKYGIVGAVFVTIAIVVLFVFKQ